MTSRIILAGAALVLAAASLPMPAHAAHPARPTVTVPSCSWDRPGHDPFTGDVVGAVDRYRDLAPDVRERLKARMAARDYDDLVSIRRDSITGKARYGSTIRDMHFGSRRVCGSVSRAKWTPQMQERGLVYCDSGQCILVPTVCRNVSRITRAEVSPEHAEGPPEDAGGGIGATPAEGGAPTVVAMGAGPSFAAPAGIEEPLGRGGPTGAEVGAPELPITRPAALERNPGSPEPAGSFARDEGPPFLPAGAPPPGDYALLPVTIPSFVAAPVPEPETWALMLSGLAVLGWLRRRASRRQVR